MKMRSPKSPVQTRGGGTRKVHKTTHANTKLQRHRPIIIIIFVSSFIVTRRRPRLERARCLFARAGAGGAGGSAAACAFPVEGSRRRRRHRRSRTCCLQRGLVEAALLSPDCACGSDGAGAVATMACSEWIHGCPCACGWEPCCCWCCYCCVGV